jgi:hypothetical protein
MNLAHPHKKTLKPQDLRLETAEQTKELKISTKNITGEKERREENDTRTGSVQHST